MIFALAPVRTQAQTFYEIEGVVEGPDSNPLNGVTVLLEDLTRARIAQAITSSDGRYRFNRIVAGTYYIVVKPSTSEFRTAVRRVELLETTRVGSSSSMERVDIALEAMPRRSEFGLATLFAQDVPPKATEKFEKLAYKLGGAQKAASANLYLASVYTKRNQNRQAIDALEAYLRDSPKAA
jgi:hypothetical protein